MIEQLAICVQPQRKQLENQCQVDLRKKSIFEWSVLKEMLIEVCT